MTSSIAPFPNNESKQDYETKYPASRPKSRQISVALVVGYCEQNSS